MNPPTFAKKRKPPATAELTTCLPKKTRDCLISCNFTRYGICWWGNSAYTYRYSIHDVNDFKKSSYQNQFKLSFIRTSNIYNYRNLRQVVFCMIYKIRYQLGSCVFFYCKNRLWRMGQITSPLVQELGHQKYIIYREIGICAPLDAITKNTSTILSRICWCS